MLLSGQKPFRDNNNEALQKKIMSGKYEPLTGDRWRDVSDPAKDLVKKLLFVDPQLGLSADYILQHGCFSRDKETSRRALAVMGLNGSEGDSGRGSMLDLEGEGGG